MNESLKYISDLFYFYNVRGYLIGYKIEPQLINCKSDGDNPTFVSASEITTLKFIPFDEYELPNSIIVEGANLISWDNKKGILIINNLKDNFKIIINAYLIYEFKKNGLELNIINSKYIKNNEELILL